MNKCCETIEVTNLSDGEIVNHPILLLKCRIIPNGKKEELTTQQLRPTSPQATYLITPLSRMGVFKVLLDLRDFENDKKDTVIDFCFSFRSKDAQKILNFRFQQERRLNQQFQVQPVLIQCVDKKMAQAKQDQLHAVVDLNLQLVKCIFADRLRTANVGRKIFVLNNCCTFQTYLTCAALWQLDSEELWQQIAGELLNSSIWKPNLKFIAFISCTDYNGSSVAASGDYSYVNIRRHLKGHVAMGSGGLALFSTAYFYAWPQEFQEILSAFNSLKEVDCSVHPDDSNYRRTFCGVYATTLGAVCHELGHIFNLGHTKEGIMGTGFDYINRLFTVDSNTEALPERMFNEAINSPSNPLQRFTHLKPRNRNSFLDKYRKQQKCDEEDCIFTRNCAVMLSFHKWFNSLQYIESDSKSCNCIKVMKDSCDIIIYVFPYVLKLIEVRTIVDSLVVWYKEFSNYDAYRFNLPIKLINQELENIYLIVMTTNGEIENINVCNILHV